MTPDVMKKYACLHGCILVFTISSMLSKYASAYITDPFSLKFILLFGGTVFVMGIYALAWQQIIKRFKPSVAYSNKSVTTIWTLIISSLLFGETITLGNIVGSILIVGGVILVAQDE